jgi:hypothetical protein
MNLNTFGVFDGENFSLQVFENEGVKIYSNR